LNLKVLAAGLVVAASLLGVLVANLGRDPHVVDSPLVGRPAPSFSLAPVGGGAPLTLPAGRPVVLNFWASWCMPCFEEHPVLVRAARDLGSDVQFLGVVYEDEEQRIHDFLGRQGSSYPSLLDPDARTAIAYGVFGVPETFFIDRQGKIVAKHVGPLDDETLLKDLRLAGLGR
jgi:cytochrome c biogenesis protein CcmG/thiol:disulfide interchange protein DsbE